MTDSIPLSLADYKPPTLHEMLALPRKDGSKINIPKQIGCEYTAFGILLLRDKNGQFVRNIIHQNEGKSVEINISILEEWLKGRGGWPISWNFLIEVFREMSRHDLAQDVEGKLYNSTQM